MSDSDLLKYRIFLVLKTIDASSTELKYFEQNWSIFDNLLKLRSSSELLMNIAIMKPNMQVFDYLILFVGCLIAIKPVKMLIGIIDNGNEFDKIISMPKFIKRLLKFLTHIDPRFISTISTEQLLINKIFAHIFKKFPDLMKMNFMKVKSKNSGLHYRFSDQFIEEYF